MKIALITGSCGLVGAEAAEFFIRKKFKVLGIDNNFRKYFFGLEGSTLWMKNFLKKKYKKPNEEEKNALKALIKTLENCNDEMTPEEIQTLIYSTGKENGYTENLRDWFKLIYEVIFGDENGPRMGFFISFFGVNETKQLIEDKIK